MFLALWRWALRLKLDNDNHSTENDYSRKISERYASNSTRKLSRDYSVPAKTGPKIYNGGSEIKSRDVDEESDMDGLYQEETGAKESVVTPEPTFENEPRYTAAPAPPDTPKKSPEKKAESNPLLKLAVPRSARSRKISFKDENEKKEAERKIVKDDSDEMSDEEEEILSLDTEARTFSQEIVTTSQAVMVCKARPDKEGLRSEV